MIRYMGSMCDRSWLGNRADLRLSAMLSGLALVAVFTLPHLPLQIATPQHLAVSTLHMMAISPALPEKVVVTAASTAGIPLVPG